MKNNQIVILGAGKPLNNQIFPYLLKNKVNKYIKSFLFFLINRAFKRRFFITGFEKKKISHFISKDFKLLENKNWKKDGPCGSLMRMIDKLNDSGLVLSYSDIIFNQFIINKILKNKNKINIVIDNLNFKKKKVEKIKYKNTNYEFLGLIYLPKNVVKYLKKNKLSIKKKYGEKKLSYLIKYLSKNFKNKYIFSNNNCTECLSSKDYEKFIFRNKATALKNIKGFDKNIFIENFFSFTFNEWKKNRQYILKNIKEKLKQTLIVRSSSSAEDQVSFSNAGKYLSILNVKNSKKNLISSINKVFISYEKIKKKDEVIVQNMLTGNSDSGVLLTQNLENNNPYQIIVNNEKNISNDTTLITSGKSNIYSKYYLYNNLNKNLLKKNKFKNLINFSEKFKSETSFGELDIEYAINNNKTSIFQIRKLITNKNEEDIFNIDKKINIHFKNLKKIYKNYKNKKLIFSNMSDWNPAEMIGYNAKPLSRYLYDHLILNKNWHTQRVQCGYNSSSITKLSSCIGNQVYINLIKDFNSFIPSYLKKKTREKILNYYLNKLSKNQFLHDKIENKIIFSNLNLNSNRLINKNLKKILTNNEIKKFLESLYKINCNIINLVKKNYFKLKKLNQNSIDYKKRYNNSDKISDFFKIINVTKNNFVIPFAHLARGSFVSKDIVHSFLSNNDLDKYFKSIKTISSKFRQDIYKLNKKEFLFKYGHLKPNTYNVDNFKLNYKNLKESFFNKKNIIIPKINSKKFLKKRISSHKLKKMGFKNILDLDNFVSNSTKGRELSKFIFSRNINIALNILKNWSYKKQINISDVNFINGKFLSQLKKNKLPQKYIMWIIKNNKKNYFLNSKLILPDVIEKPENIFFFKEINNTPTFIGKNLISKTVVYSKNIRDKNIFKNKIVLIPNADPGFEFLFHIGIKGIITKYGNPNSHMSIRSNELNLTSVIGVGNKFEEIAKMNTININVKEKIVKIAN